MTTATSHAAVRPAADRPPPPQPDLETRLTLASAAMDAVMAHRHPGVLEEADAAVQAVLSRLPEDTPQWRPEPTLVRAAELIRERGWARHVFTGPRGELCALAAIELAAGGNRSRQARAEAELRRRIAVTTGVLAGIACWNDSRPDAGAVLALLG